ITLRQHAHSRSKCPGKGFGSWLRDGDTCVVGMKAHSIFQIQLKSGIGIENEVELRAYSGSTRCEAVVAACHCVGILKRKRIETRRSEEHTSELQSRENV